MVAIYKDKTDRLYSPIEKSINILSMRIMKFCEFVDLKLIAVNIKKRGLLLDFLLVMGIKANTH